jgi:cytochrome c oxidase subunit IV
MRWLATRLGWSLGILAVLFTAIFLHAYMGWSGPTIVLIAVAGLLVAIFVRLGRRFG